MREVAAREECVDRLVMMGFGEAGARAELHRQRGDVRAAALALSGSR